jgi:tetratricopeptide (TPR) repeat protein
MKKTQEKPAARRLLDHSAAAPAALVAVAVVLRAFHLAAVTRSPLGSLPVVDEQAYDAWAQEIAAGDWIGSEAYFQSPLYPYLLGGLYALFGRSLFVVRLVQHAAGALTPLLLYWLGTRLFDRRAGLIAGAIGAAYPVFLFHEGMIEKSWMMVVLVPAVLLLLLRAQDRGRGFFVAGLVLGVSAIVRENLLLAVPAIALGLWLRPRAERTYRPGRAAALLLGGVLVTIAPFTVRNAIVAREFVLTTAQAGQNFYTGNNPRARTGTYVAPEFVRPNPLYEQADFRSEAEARTGRKMTANEVSSYWLGEAIAWIRQHPEQFRWLTMMRFLLFWNKEELPDNHYFGFFRKEVSPVLRVPIAFGWIAPLGIAGFLLFAGRIRKLFPVYVLSAFYCASVCLFLVFDRYRLPIVPVVIVMASGTIVWIAERRRRPVPLVTAGALIAAGAVLSNVTLVEVPMAAERMNLGRAYVLQGDVAAGIRHLEEAVRERPDVDEIQRELAKAYLAAGRLEEAIGAMRRAIALDPHELQTRVTLAEALARVGDHRGAAAEYRAALETRSAYHEGLARLDVRMRIVESLHVLGDERGIVEEYRAALAESPDEPKLLNNLAWLLATASDPAVWDAREAVRLAERAIELGSDRFGTLAEAHFRGGNAARAVEIAERALEAGKGDLEFYRRRLPEYREAASGER